MPKPKNAPSAQKQQKSLFEFIPAGKLRSLVEIIVSSLPGAIILGASVFLTGVFNIYKNLSEPNNAFVIVR